MKINTPMTYSIVLHILLVGLAADVIFLSKQVKDLRRVASVGRLAEGDFIPSMAVMEMDGSKSRLEFDDTAEETLLFVFTTTCSVCKRNLGNWRELHNHFQDRYNFVGVSASDLEVTKSYKSEYSLPFRVVVPNDATKFARSLGISTVPQTLLIGKDGKLRGLWPGLLPAEFSDRLEESALPQRQASF